MARCESWVCSSSRRSLPGSRPRLERYYVLPRVVTSRAPSGESRDLRRNVGQPDHILANSALRQVRACNFDLFVALGLQLCGSRPRDHLRRACAVLPATSTAVGCHTAIGDEVMTQPQAWAAHDRWLKNSRVDFVDEPAGIEIRFRALTRLQQPATKDWADACLAAFARCGFSVAT